MEKTPGKYGFSELNKLIAIISKYKTHIILTIGLKAPRWPEFYIHNWLADQLKIQHNTPVDHPRLRKPLFAFIQKPLQRYEKIKAIKFIQLENEPFINAGPKYNFISEDLFAGELKLARKLTKNHS